MKIIKALFIGLALIPTFLYADSGKKTKFYEFLNELSKSIESKASSPANNSVPDKATSKKTNPCNGVAIDESRFDITGIRLGSICMLSESALSSTNFDGYAEKIQWAYRDGISLYENISSLYSHIKQAEFLEQKSPFAIASFKGKNEFAGYKLQIVIDKYSGGVAGQDDLYITKVGRSFCAADVANSLDRGNGFRMQLDKKYGAAPLEKSVDSELKRLSLERASATQKMRAQAGNQAMQDLHTISLMGINQQINKLALAKSAGKNVFELEYAGKYGDTFVIQASEDQFSCGERSLFTTTLSASDATLKEFIVKASKSKIEFDAAQSGKAATPSL